MKEQPSKEERKRLLIEMLNDKSDELDREAKSHQVTNTEQLLVNAGASKKEDEKNGMYEKSDNELIAEFMGGYNHDFGTRVFGLNIPHMDDRWFDVDELQYNTSWDWLMPVVEKISLIIYESYTDNNGYKDVPVHDRAYMRTFGMIDNEGKWMVRINRMPPEQEDTLIMAVYKAVVEFIKSHNSQQHERK